MSKGSLITDEDIKEITQSFVDVANKDGVLSDVFEHYKVGRSMAIRVVGTRINTGFIVKDGSIQMLTGLHKPTVTVSMTKETYWDIINSDSSNIARAKIYAAIYTEERLLIDPPPGAAGGALHLQNIIAIFTKIAQSVMG